MKLEIPSTKYRFFSLHTIIGILLCLIMVAISMIVIVTDLSIGSFIIGGLLIAFSLYSIWGYYSTYQWVTIGTENLIIDKPKGSFHYYKLDSNKFDEHKTNLKSLSEFRWCMENDEYVDVHPREGLQGGRICFWINGQKVRFGISLSKDAARSCIDELNAFLS